MLTQNNCRKNRYCDKKRPASTVSGIPGRRPVYRKHRPDIGAAVAASLTGELRFEIGQPDMIGPAIGVDHDRMPPNLKGRRHFRAATRRAQNSFVLQNGFDPPFSPGPQRLNQIFMSEESKLWF
jgi:hypothetical protein